MWRLVSWAVVFPMCVLASACGDESPPAKDPGSPEIIRQLAEQNLSVEDFDVCQAIRDAGAEDDLATILDAESVFLEGGFSAMEDALVQRCAVTTDDNEGGDTELSVALIQGTEFGGVDANDPVVFPGCRVGQAWPGAGAAAVRAQCEPSLFIDVNADFLRESAIQPWTDGPDGEPAQEYVDLLADVLRAVSAQG